MLRLMMNSQWEQYLCLEVAVETILIGTTKYRKSFHHQAAHRHAQPLDRIK
jgi:hypothetical protein